MYQLRPLIKDVDPDWAKKPEDQNEQLRGAVAIPATSMVGGNCLRLETGASQTNALNSVKASDVDELAQKEPAQALTRQ